MYLTGDMCGNAPQCKKGLPSPGTHPLHHVKTPVAGTRGLIRFCFHRAVFQPHGHVLRKAFRKEPAAQRAGNRAQFRSIPQSQTQVCLTAMGAGHMHCPAHSWVGQHAAHSFSMPHPGKYCTGAGKPGGGNSGANQPPRVVHQCTSSFCQGPA